MLRPGIQKHLSFNSHLRHAYDELMISAEDPLLMISAEDPLLRRPGPFWEPSYTAIG